MRDLVGVEPVERGDQGLPGIGRGGELDELLDRERAQGRVRIAQQLDERERIEVRRRERREPRGDDRGIGIEQRGRQPARRRGARRRVERDGAPARAQERDGVLVRRGVPIGVRGHRGADLEIARAEHAEHAHGGVAHAPEWIGERGGERRHLVGAGDRGERVDRRAADPPRAIRVGELAQHRDRGERGLRSGAREATDHGVAHERRAIADRVEQPALDGEVDGGGADRERAEPAGGGGAHLGVGVGEQHAAQDERVGGGRRGGGAHAIARIRGDEVGDGVHVVSLRATSRLTSEASTERRTCARSGATSSSIQKCSTRVPAMANER
ncbi:MAG: hypothetical protein NT062_27145 [Proteobacteria bacterium]|nr:hypothetical protein [Pseudomonadota bacterium]